MPSVAPQKRQTGEVWAQAAFAPASTPAASSGNLFMMRGANAKAVARLPGRIAPYHLIGANGGGKSGSCEFSSSRVALPAASQ